MMQVPVAGEMVMDAKLNVTIALLSIESYHVVLTHNKCFQEVDR